MYHQQATGLDESLAKITKETSIAFLGAGVGLVFAFLNRVLIARIVTETEYGIFSLAFVILNICAVIGTVGLQQGTPRMIAFARGQGNEEKVKSLISAAIKLGLIASIMLAITLFIISDLIAKNVFNQSQLGYPLRVVAIGLPFFVLINVQEALFRGFDNVKPKVYFLDLLRNFIFIIFLLPFLFMDWSFNGIFYAFAGSFLITFIALAAYTVKRLPVCIYLTATAGTRELLTFSLPLVAINMLDSIIVWTDTLMLGGFKTATDVGLYNTAQPIAFLLTFPLTAMILIYLPVVSGLYAQGLMDEIRKNYMALTRWICAAVFPLFLVMVVYPDTVLSLLFGASYSSAGNALRILSIGFITNTLFGFNWATLIAMGRTYFIMWTTLFAAIINVILNISLIPIFGIEGAAVASLVAFVMVNMIRSWKMYRINKIKPLDMNMIKPIIVSAALVLSIQFILDIFIETKGWMLPFLLMLYYVIYGLTILFTKSFVEEDLALLKVIQIRVVKKISPLISIIRRFI